MEEGRLTAPRRVASSALVHPVLRSMSEIEQRRMRAFANTLIDGDGFI